MLRRQKTDKRPGSEIAFIGNFYSLPLSMSRRANLAIKYGKTRKLIRIVAHFGGSGSKIPEKDTQKHENNEMKSSSVT
jgi:hypothetical protein